MGRKAVWFLTMLILFAALSGIAFSAGERMPRSVISSGGGLVGSDHLLLQSVVGQPVAGPVSGELALCSGFRCGTAIRYVPEVTYNVYLPVVLAGNG